jgi:hypothetical protein
MGCFFEFGTSSGILCRAFLSAEPLIVSIGGHTTVSPRLGL